MTGPTTLAQLPNAATYYEESVKDGLFTYKDSGKDAAGRRVYQKLLDGEEYGSPRALLTFLEYRAKVLAWAKLSSCMGVTRWTTPLEAT